MSTYQINNIDCRLTCVEGKIQDWEKIIDVLMANPRFMDTLAAADPTTKNQPADPKQ